MLGKMPAVVALIGGSGRRWGWGEIGAGAGSCAPALRWSCQADTGRWWGIECVPRPQERGGRRRQAQKGRRWLRAEEGRRWLRAERGRVGSKRRRGVGGSGGGGA